MTQRDQYAHPDTDGPVLARYESLVADLLSGVIVWGGIGWALDTWVLHTWPWAMVGGVILGFAAGTYLLYVRSEELGRAEDERRAAGRRHDRTTPRPDHETQDTETRGAGG